MKYATFALAALGLLPALLSSRVEAQTFAVGLLGSLVNDTGTASNVGSFGTAGAHLFGEMDLEKDVFLQVRLSRFGLPGTTPNAPNLLVDSATASVGYLFREEWWRAGFFAGLGGYRLKPRDAEPGQDNPDTKENVFGWHGGLVTEFDISSRWDARLEASGHLIRSNVGHKPLLITLGVAYHF